MGRIVYLAHDTDQPSGGVAVLYDHVYWLRRHGADAWIAHGGRGPGYAFAERQVPVVTAASTAALGPDDWLVIPENHLPALRELDRFRCRKVLFCQNHYYMALALGASERPLYRGIDHAMCVSVAIRDCLREWFGFDAGIVPVAIPDYFTPAPKTALSIAYMPRKGEGSIDIVRQLLRHAPPLPVPLHWQPVSGVSRREAAALLGRSSIYLATGHWEGLGLPSIEGMAAGCIVVGYVAGGGSDYANPHNGLWVHDEQPFALARALGDLLRMSVDDREAARLAALRTAGIATAARYSEAVAVDALIGFWRRVGAIHV